MQIILLIILIAAVAVVIFLLLSKKESKDDSKSLQAMAVMMERLNAISGENKELRRAVDNKLSESHRSAQDNIAHSSKVMQGMHNQSVSQISKITEKLSKLEETNKQVVGFSEQLKDLQDILKNPKQRGVLGEYFLEDTLKNVLPS